MTSKLPVLAVYMGHKTLAGTQWYLHLTEELSTDLVRNLDRQFSHIIPTGEQA